MIEWISLRQDLCLRLVSPSKFLVSTQARPLELLDLSKMRSAGKYQSELTCTTQPTHRLYQMSYQKFLFFLFSLRIFLQFSILSDLCLFRSSKISLIADTVMTNIRGKRIVGCPFVIDTCGIVYSKRLVYEIFN